MHMLDLRALSHGKRHVFTSGAASGGGGGGSGGGGVPWWIITIAVIASIAAVAVGVLTAFLVYSKGKCAPLQEDPDALLKVLF